MDQLRFGDLRLIDQPTLIASSGNQQPIRNQEAPREDLSFIQEVEPGLGLEMSDDIRNQLMKQLTSSNLQ